MNIYNALPQGIQQTIQIEYYKTASENPVTYFKDFEFNKNMEFSKNLFDENRYYFDVIDNRGQIKIQFYFLYLLAMSLQGYIEEYTDFDFAKTKAVVASGEY